MAASPTNIRARYPRERPKQANINDFLPYVTNLANMFRRVPQPMAPNYMDPVRTGRISLAGTKQQVNEATRAADLATEGLDAQTGAAIRTGNLANRIRGISLVNQEESNYNTQLSNQANLINAQIMGQNVGIHNEYQDQQVQARIAGQREQSENLANFSDKITQSIVRKDQMKLEGDRAKVLSRMYDRGLYSRFTGYLKDKGVDVPGGYEEDEQGKLERLAEQLRGSSRKRYAAGGMMKVLSGDPIPKVKGNKSDHTSPDYSTTRMDAVNYSIASGTNPATTQYGKALMSNYDNGVELANAVNVFNTRPDLKGMDPEQRVRTFYAMQGGTPVVQQFRNQYRTFSYGPNVAYRNMMAFNPDLKQPTSNPVATTRENGGSIHIKPENRGKFTAWAQSHGMGVQEAASKVMANKDEYSTGVVKMANFARNFGGKKMYGGRMSRIKFSC